jgi:hypothetical protein
MHTQSGAAEVLAMVEELPDRNRKAFKDMFYTHPAVMQAGADWLLKHVKPAKKRRISVFDFSAGDGAFEDALEQRFSAPIYHAFDIHPTSNCVKQADFLELPSEYASQIRDCDVACFNPPFGREGRTAIQFWRAALQHKPKWMLLILPFRPWKLSNMQIKEQKLLGPNAFYTIEDGVPFSVASEMLLLKCNYANGVIPTVSERKDFAFEVTDTRKPLRFPTSSMLFVRKVGFYAGKQCYVMTKDAGQYQVCYFEQERSEPQAEETFIVPIVGKWPRMATPWGRRGHIVCMHDEGAGDSRGGQGFLKVYLPDETTHAQAIGAARYLTQFCTKNEVAFGGPKSINCAIVRRILSSWFT